MMQQPEYRSKHSDSEFQRELLSPPAGCQHGTWRGSQTLLEIRHVCSVFDVTSAVSLPQTEKNSESAQKALNGGIQELVPRTQPDIEEQMNSTRGDVFVAAFDICPYTQRDELHVRSCIVEVAILTT